MISHPLLLLSIRGEKPSAIYFLPAEKPCDSATIMPCRERACQFKVQRRNGISLCLPQKRPSGPFQLWAENGSTSSVDAQDDGKTAGFRRSCATGGYVDHFREVTKMMTIEKPRRWSAAGRRGLLHVEVNKYGHCLMTNQVSIDVVHSGGKGFKGCSISGSNAYRSFRMRIFNKTAEVLLLNAVPFI